MPSVTVPGPGGTVVIPVTSAAAQRAGQSALAAAANAAGPLSDLQFVAAQAVTVPASAGPDVLVAAGGAATITDASAQPLTVVAGNGGLTFVETAPADGTVIVTGGGRNVIGLAGGAATVSLDITPGALTVNGVALGTGTVDALAGGAVVSVNAAPNDATHSDAALVLAGAADTVALAGDATGIATAAIGINDPSVVVTMADRSEAFIVGAFANVQAAAGDETIGVLSGSTEAVTGAARGGGSLTIARGSMLTGTLLINPRSQDVTVFGGAGVQSLFGAGDGTSANTGRDVVTDGIGYFRLGSAGNSVGESARHIGMAEATTLIGGGPGDVLYAQSGNVSLRGGYGTTVLWAAGGVSLGGNAVAPADAGVTVDAGAAAGATIAGAPTGANTIISGSGSVVVWGNHGPAGGNVYMDGAAGGQLTIMDFTPQDVFRLNAGEQVGGMQTNTVILTDGTRITVADGVVTWGNVMQFFHQ